VKSKPWYLSTKVWLAVAAGLTSLAAGLPDIGDAGPVVRGVLGALGLIVGAWVVILRAWEGEDEGSPEERLTLGRVAGGRARMGALLLALAAGAVLLTVTACPSLTPRQEAAVTTGVQGGVGLTCDVLGELFPDNEWVRVGCAAGEILAVGVLAAVMGLDAEEPASKSASVDVFEPGASPTLHVGCGAMALRCHRYGEGAAADYCAALSASCDAGVSSVALVSRGE